MHKAPYLAGYKLEIKDKNIRVQCDQINNISNLYPLLKY